MEFQVYIYEIVDDQIVRSRIIEHAIPSVNFLLHNFLKVGANGLADIIKDGMTRLHVAPTVY